ncbi:MAG: ArnT family glycosyltransferase [Candidatus Eiseniibacteriota bacterium]
MRPGRGIPASTPTVHPGVHEPPVPIAALGLVLALALALRLWGVGYGLPWLFYLHDEPQVVLRALRFGTGDLNPHFFIWPGTLLLVLAFLAFACLFLAGRGFGWWTGKEGFAAAYFADPTPFYLLPRLQSVGFGVWTVWLAFGLGRAGWGPAVGLAAALGLAVNALHAHYAHLAHPVTAMTAFVVLGLWAGLKVATDGTWRHLALGALATGLGVACQYHAGLLAVPIGIAVLYRAAGAAGAVRRRWLLQGGAAGVLAVLVFLAVSPFVVLDHRAFRADLAWITAKAAGGPTAGAGDPLSGLVAFVRQCLVPGLGVPLLVAAAAGSAIALATRTRADVLLLAFTAAYLALGSRAGSLNDRYAIPLVVPALVFAARAAGWALARLSASARLSAFGIPLAVLALSAPKALELVETDVTMTRGDTRIDALRWFEAHVPADDRVLIDMSRFWNSASPPLAENRERLTERLAEVEAGVSGGGHGAAYADFFRYRLAHPRAPAYYLRSTGMGDSALTLAAYRGAGFRWAVVSELAVGPAEARARAGDSTAIRYYRALEREAEQVAEFRPERWRRMGPVIRVYRLDAGDGMP